MAAPSPAALAGDGLALQRRAGTSCPAPPPEPVPRSPERDPGFRAVKGDIRAKARQLKQHPPAKAEAAKAQAAAEPPANDKEAKAKAAHADTLAAAKPGGFDKAAFIAAVKRAIAAKAPKNLDEADRLAESGKVESVKSEVMGEVVKGRETSARDIAEKAKQSPEFSRGKDKPVVPLRAEPAPKPAPPRAAAAMPAKAPPAQTNLGAPRCETEGQMAEAGVSEAQLANSNEPEFTDALAAKKAGEQHSATAPATVRQAEAATLRAASQGALASAGSAMAAMAGARGKAGAKVGTDKQAAKGKEEQARARVAAEIKGIFDATKADVDKILADLDTAVAKRFEDGEKAARDAFAADHTARMERYKDQRYSGLDGWARWVKDKLTRMPPEADNIFIESRKLYESRMARVISDVADLIGRELTRAKDRIAQGRAEIAKHVAAQPKELQRYAGQAATQIGQQFDQLESEVDDKQQSLVDDLATKYIEASNAVDEQIKELQAANRGLWDKAKDAIGGAIRTILQLKDMLLGVLARAAGTVTKIIKDPIGFLGKLVNAVKAGVSNFAANILEHLRKGLQGWLFGALASAGIDLPETFDLKGIVRLILSILGLTWGTIRSRIVGKIGEKAMAALEKGVEVFQILVAEGPIGLWKWVAGKLGDLWDKAMAAIQDFVVVKVIKAGITWLISLLNPAAAFIKACKAIYDIVMFFVERGSQIKEFVDSVLDSVEEVASGAVGKVAGLIENILARTVPLVISFLASLLGLGGIGDKVREVLEKVQKPVARAIDKVIDGALKLAGPIIRAAKGLIAKSKAKLLGGDDSPEGKRSRLDKGLAAAQSAVNRIPGKAIAALAARPILTAIRTRHGMTSLDLVPRGEHWAVRGVVNPEDEKPTDKENTGGQEPAAQGHTEIVSAFHGASGDKILKIIDEGKMKPKGGQVFVGKWDPRKLYMHGGDTERKAAFVIEIELTINVSTTEQKRGSTQGVPNTLELGTVEDVPVKVLRLYARSVPDEEGERTERVFEGADAIKKYLDRGKRQEFRAPASRHYLSKIRFQTLPKERNTVIAPDVDVAADVAAINEGRASKSGAAFEINGRIYGYHDDVLFPISGPGFYELDRGSFRALRVYIKYGNTDEARLMLDRERIGEGQRQAALDVFKLRR